MFQVEIAWEEANAFMHLPYLKHCCGLFFLFFLSLFPLPPPLLCVFAVFSLAHDFTDKTDFTAR